MRRPFFLVLLPGLAAPVVLLGALVVSATSAACETPASVPDTPAPVATVTGPPDANLVAPVEASVGEGADAGAPPPPAPASCEKYCDLVMKNCVNQEAQYTDWAHCMAFCAHLPQGSADDDSDAPTVACREGYAATPAETDPAQYCRRAGPFGGGVCGDRCTTFCGVTLSACPATNAYAPYDSKPDCAVACAGYALVDAGEGPGGPDGGNTLNCREFFLRQAVRDAGACATLAIDSGPCR